MNKEIADSLRAAMKSADSLDNWHKYGEGYGTLRAAVEAAIKKLDPPEQS